MVAIPSDGRRAMVEKQVSLTGLADFMTASAVRQRTIVKQYKYPDDDEARAKVLYYREARDRIAMYHRSPRAPAWLHAQATELQQLARRSPKGRSRVRLEHNARGVTAYAEHFSSKKYSVQRNLRLELRYGDVRVSVVPDLYVIDGPKPKLIKLEFGVEPPTADEVRIISQGLFEAAVAAHLDVGSAQVLYVDVPRGIEHKGARAGARMQRNIEASCHNFSAIWDTV